MSLQEKMLYSDAVIIIIIIIMIMKTYHPPPFINTNNAAHTLSELKYFLMAE